MLRLKSHRLKSRKILIIAAVLTAAAAIFLYAVLDPAVGRFFPKCPFYMLTGLECPGCGSQRAVHSLLRGDIAAAVHYNVLVVAFIPYLLLYVVLVLTARLPLPEKHAAAGRKILETLYHGKILWGILAIVIIFWITRNFTGSF